MPTSHPLLGEPDPEKLLTCPYNPSHRVARKRLQFHLTTCRQGHLDAKKEVCPFDSTHVINEQEIKFHLEVCPNRGIVDNFKHVTTDVNHIIKLPPPPDVPPSEENWSDECCETYNPMDKLEKAPIIHTLIGATRSERKRNRKLQRQKFSALDGHVPAAAETKPPRKREELSDDKPLRQPNTRPTFLGDESTRSVSLNSSFASGKTENSGPSKIKAESTAAGLANAVDDEPWNPNRLISRTK